MLKHFLIFFVAMLLFVKMYRMAQLERIDKNCFCHEYLIHGEKSILEMGKEKKSLKLGFFFFLMKTSSTNSAIVTREILV